MKFIKRPRRHKFARSSRKIRRVGGVFPMSKKGKLRLLKRFCHRLYVRTQHNNLLFATQDPAKRVNYFSSIGLMADYKHKKKKKKDIHGWV